MLSDFVKKKRNLFDYKKTEFFKIQKIAFFPKGSLMLLTKKCQFFSYLQLIKIRVEIMLSDIAEKKKPFLALKNRIFDSPKNRIFSKSELTLLTKKFQFGFFIYN